MNLLKWMHRNHSAKSMPKSKELQARRIALTEMENYVANSPPLLTLLAMAFALATWVAYGVISPVTLSVWASVYLVIFLARVWALRVFKAKSEESKLSGFGRWLSVLGALNVASGAVWGVFAWIVIPILPLFDKILITWMLVIFGALAAISTPTKSINLRLYLAATLGPGIAAWLGQESAESWAMAFSLSILVVIYDGVGRRYFREVHKRLTYANELAYANEMLRESNLSKTRLIVEASHDLRQPVHAVGMMLDRFDTRSSRDELERRLKEVRGCVNSVADMLTDLLDLSHLESGEYIAELQPVDLHRLLREFDQTYGPMAQRKGLEWIVSRSGPWVCSDPIMLKRIMNNLISNAIKYTHYGGVGVSCQVLGDRVEIRVTDTGIGIPADRLEVIFREYVRLSDTDEEPGYGIGLSVVKRMVDLLGHRLRVTSKLGRGSRFSLWLQKVETSAQFKAEAIPGDWNLQLFLGKVIVLIENDEILRSSTAEVLTSWGALVLAGSSWEEALSSSAINFSRPDVVISDLHLGGKMNGIEAIDEIRRRYLPIPLPAILLTGDLKPEVQAKARAMDIRIAYKPLRPKRLHEMLRGTFSGQRSEPAPLMPSQ